MFVDRFDETMEIAARAVQIELTLPWYFQMKKFYGEDTLPTRRRSIRSTSRRAMP